MRKYDQKNQNTYLGTYSGDGVLNNKLICVRTVLFLKVLLGRYDMFHKSCCHNLNKQNLQLIHKSVFQSSNKFIYIFDAWVKRVGIV